MLWLKYNPDDLKTKRELDLYATIRDLQRQVSELREEREVLLYGPVSPMSQDHADGCALYKAMNGEVTE